MDRLLRLLRAPGARHAVEVAAPTQKVLEGASSQEGGLEKLGGDLAIIPSTNNTTYVVPPKPRRLDRYLDQVVEWSGSQFVFFIILFALITWAFLGIPFSGFTQWTVGISDGRAIINLIFDSFLMRQQLNSYDRTMDALGVLKSRGVNCKRMLRELVREERERRGDEGETQYEARKNSETSQPKKEAPDAKIESDEDSAKTVTQPMDTFDEDFIGFVTELPQETLFGRICTTVSNITGHIVTVVIFWVGIVVWVAFGARDSWSPTWLLYINSATSALMVFVLAFLANIHERHGEYSNRCLEAIWKVDAALELRLRAATGDSEPNLAVTIPAPNFGRIQRVIDYYADLVGALIGVAILILTIVVWVAIGPAMRFNSNWWLLIGTYAGLVGMNDGFVLRNVFHKLRGYEDGLFEEVAWVDEDALQVLDSLQPLPTQRRQSHASMEQGMLERTLTERISLRMGAICSHEYTVILGVVSIVGLVIGASAMRWSLTGQLMCNVPPSIIETFFMMILITGHNLSDQRRRRDLSGLHKRRLRLLRGVQGVVGGRSGAAGCGEGEMAGKKVGLGR